jgi:hypothetical protein
MSFCYLFANDMVNDLPAMQVHMYIGRCCIIHSTLCFYCIRCHLIIYSSYNVLIYLCIYILTAELFKLKSRSSAQIITLSVLARSDRVVPLMI